MNTLLQLQELDAKIQTCLSRESEIPKQKNKFNIHRERLKAELLEREKIATDLQLEQKACEGNIEQCQTQITKYNEQLNVVKKNEEYQALLHEIELQKKQIAANEERILTIMVELDEAKARLEEDNKRIKSEQNAIDSQCAEIDDELKEAMTHRQELENQRVPLVEGVPRDLYSKYQRIRRNITNGSVVVPLKGEVCGGCHMHLLAQVVNEILAGDKIHGCQHCGRLLYHPPNFEALEEAEAEKA